MKTIHMSMHDFVFAITLTCSHDGTGVDIELADPPVREMLRQIDANPARKVALDAAVHSICRYWDNRGKRARWKPLPTVGGL